MFSNPAFVLAAQKPLYPMPKSKKPKYVDSIRALFLGISTADKVSTTAKLSTELFSHMSLDKEMTSIHLGQQCAAEGYTLLVDALGPRVEDVCASVYEVSIRCKNCNHTHSVDRDRAFDLKMFTDSAIATQLQFQNWIWFHTSEIDTYVCETCNAVSSATRHERLRMLREVVIVSFNKYYEKTLKWFPTHFELKSTTGSMLRWKLTAVIEHFGDANGGHYRAIVLRGNQWWIADDTTITETTEPVPTAETFVVSYSLE